MSFRYRDVWKLRVKIFENSKTLFRSWETSISKISEFERYWQIRNLFDQQNCYEAFSYRAFSLTNVTSNENNTSLARGTRIQKSLFQFGRSRYLPRTACTSNRDIARKRYRDRVIFLFFFFERSLSMLFSSWRKMHLAPVRLYTWRSVSIIAGNSDNRRVCAAQRWNTTRFIRLVVDSNASVAWLSPSGQWVI